MKRKDAIKKYGLENVQNAEKQRAARKEEFARSFVKLTSVKDAVNVTVPVPKKLYDDIVACYSANQNLEWESKKMSEEEKMRVAIYAILDVLVNENDINPFSNF